MEKITDEDLKEMLTKPEEASKDVEENIIRNAETGEVQLEKHDGPINLEEENLQDALEQDIDFNTIPENVENHYEERPLNPILERRDELNIGLSVDDISELCRYVSGRGQKPLFIDRFTSDVEGRLRDMTLIMNLYQINQIPMLTELRNQVINRLFSPENFYDMDSKVLSATLNNLNKDIQGIIDGSNKSVQTTAQYGSLNSKYRSLVDSLLQLPAEKLDLIDTILNLPNNEFDTLKDNLLEKDVK